MRSISPLSLKWADASPVLIFDSEVHGDHGEMQCSAKYRGDGEPKPFECPHCGGKRFTVSVQFDYRDACDDLWEEDPVIAIQDYF